MEEKKTVVKINDIDYVTRYKVNRDINQAVVTVWVDYEDLSQHTGKEFEYSVTGLLNKNILIDWGTGYNPKENMDTKNEIVRQINNAEKFGH